jgi:UDP-N-acetylglucosamine 2-epimerase
VLVPVLDEAPNVPRLLGNLARLADDVRAEMECRLVLVDDGSRDGTADRVRQEAGSLPVEVLRHEVNLGPGRTFATGFVHLAPLLAEQDWVATMEGDNTSKVETLRQMLVRRREGFEVVLASPYMYGGGLSHTTMLRVVMSHVANGLVKELLGIHGILTMSSFFRLYAAPVVRRLQARYGAGIIETSGFECMVELLAKLIEAGATISEVAMPLDGSQRLGKSKMRLRRTIRGSPALLGGAPVEGAVRAAGHRPVVVTVVGARPQFVKAAPLSRALRRRVREVLVHTGQHYDPEMSQAFFDALDIPAPDHHLGIGSGSHGAMTGRMLEALEAVLLQVRPALVLVLGDTNSTLAGALAAAKLHIPVAHVEAGLRSFDSRMPEEVNRRVADHVSRLLFCPTPTAVRNLGREGIRRGVHRVGDVMMDAVVQNLARARRLGDGGGGFAPGTYYLATLHRQENVDDPERLAALIGALERLPHPTVLPLHPRTRERLKRAGRPPGGALRMVPPLGYLEMLRMESGARAIFTDSGGVQKEAFILGTPCVTLRAATEWVETLKGGANRLVGADPRRILAAARAIERKRPRPRAGALYGRGRASEAIARIVARFLDGAA